MYPPLFEAGKVTGYNYIEAKAPKCHQKFKKSPQLSYTFQFNFHDANSSDSFHSSMYQKQCGVEA